jgi:hypothetical protein
MNPFSLMLKFLALASCVVVMSRAYAVCLDPKDPNLATYYYPSLEDEVTSAYAIVVGNVIRVDPLREDLADPDGWTAFTYTFRVTQQLRGSVPLEIVLRAENDSGGYRMDENETHLLFLEKRDEFYHVSPCGNSTKLPKGYPILERLKTMLVGQPMRAKQ